MATRRAPRKIAPAEDGLHEYRAKRDFAATPEPAPDRGRDDRSDVPGKASSKGRSKARPESRASRSEATPTRSRARRTAAGEQPLPPRARFVVHEHHARRLHWDLRLEHDGALLSWAIPNGIPTDPRENRKAVHVEDHPLEYLDFEATIPAGSYGAGRISIWDRGEYECEKLEDGKLVVVFHGERLRGRYALFRTGGPARRARSGARRGSDSNGDTGTEVHVNDGGGGEGDRGGTKGDGGGTKGDGGGTKGDPDDGEDVGRDAVGGRPRDRVGGRPNRSDRAGVRATAHDSDDEKNWMIHRMDPPETPRQPMPEHVVPMLASPAPLPRREDGWAFELKWDGVRALAYLKPGRVHIESRNRNAIDSRYPELRALGRQLGMREALLDGEIVAFDEHGAPSFERLARRMHQTSEHTIRRLAEQLPVTYVIFDLLHLDGRSTMDLPYAQRRALLEELQLSGPAWQTPANHTAGHARALLRATATRGLEGLVAKALDSPYRPGERSREWLKIKNTARQELVIGGWLPGKGNREGSIGALLMGYYERVGAPDTSAKPERQRSPSDSRRAGDERENIGRIGRGRRVLRYAGRVGTGFDDAELRRLQRELNTRARRTSPFAGIGVQPPREARYIKPNLVAEIEFSHWTRDTILRHSVYRGLRADKPAREVVREERPAAAPRGTADADGLAGEGGVGADADGLAGAGGVGEADVVGNRGGRVRTRSSGGTKRAGASDTEGAGASDTEGAGASDTEGAGASDTEGAGASDTKRAGASDTEGAGASDTKRAGASDTEGAGASGYEIVHETKRHTEIAVAGRTLRLSNRDKLLYPDSGFTKGQLIDYYAAIAPTLLPHLAGHPLTLKRYPDGVQSEYFYEKRCPAHRPDWVRTVPVDSEQRGGPIDYCLVEDLPTLVWLANLAAIELHPSLARAEALDTPTALVFDLDPGAPAALRECCRVALHIRELFDALELRSFVKTSGAKGLQVYVPLNTPLTYEQTKPFARAVAQLLEKRHPKLVTSRMAKNARGGLVLIDWSQNDPHKTTICVYSLRATPRPLVSTPLHWEQVQRAARARREPQLSLEPGPLLDRVARDGDPHALLPSLVQRLPEFADAAHHRGARDRS